MRIPRANCSSFVSMTMPSICGAVRGGEGADLIASVNVVPLIAVVSPDSWAGCSVVGRTRSRSTKVPFCWWLRLP